MADILCVHCAEPWDSYELHEMGDYIGRPLTYEQARKRFYKLGCGAFDDGNVPCKRGTAQPSPLAPYIRAAQDMLGDDVDGLASLTDSYPEVE